MERKAELFQGKGPQEISKMKTEIVRQRTILSRDAVNMGLVPFFDGFFWTDPEFKSDWFNQQDRGFVYYLEQVKDGKLDLIRYETNPVNVENRADETILRIAQLLLVSRNPMSYWDNFQGMKFSNTRYKLRKSRAHHR